MIKIKKKYNLKRSKKLDPDPPSQDAKFMT